MQYELSVMVNRTVTVNVPFGCWGGGGGDGGPLLLHPCLFTIINTHKNSQLWQQLFSQLSSTLVGGMCSMCCHMALVLAFMHSYSILYLGLVLPFFFIIILNLVLKS